MTAHRWRGSGAPPPPDPVPLHERDWAWRNRLRALPGVGHFYKLLVGLVGLLIVVLGLILVPFPGPGWAIVFLGVLVWATEFPPASRLLSWGRGKVVDFGHWVARRGWPARVALGVVTFLTATVIVWCIAFVFGHPPALPAVVGDLLTRWAGLPPEPVWSR
ncbi:TIGR02611 family protein [Kytococcus sp. Marseille-QA3725]